MSVISPAKREGILLVNKPSGVTSFSLVRNLRRLTGEKKIGHAGTLDPFATGVMVLLIGRPYTRLADDLLTDDKIYEGRVRLGITTTTFDPEGDITATSDLVPSPEQINKALAQFQGTIAQIPPMFSAKKVNGQKLCDLARKGKEVERKPVQVFVQTTLLDFSYPYLDVRVACSKGTYIRSIAHDLGQVLGCGAHLEELKRTKSGRYDLDECIDGRLLEQPIYDPTPHLRQLA